ncbi:TonB-dependent receptor [Aestuariibacter sp. GS-14]|uniref:TonB-dependent receptor n=1 Tax=Aestuariibacter sp. GS-14 TaxID=2590670 RepID=UPI00112AF3E9|nr:TonB-dependent receptor [Aestuariibacter sp. GS-14]TPV56495.1 TonB-dependent receptor [Aestuariibacter sp. GS-14]
MMTKSKFNRVAIAVAMSVGLSAAAMAQETSSGINGRVVGPQGAPAAGTVITVKHVPTGSVKTITANANGQFSLSGLRVGGPYEITMDSDTFEDATITDVYLSLSEPLNLNNFQLATQADVERIEVTASQIASIAFGQKGPSSNFSLEELQNAPAINRDIKDLVRADPRVYIDESFSDGIQCAGASPRFNSLTLDGMRLNDNFGLNSNGYPTESIPFSYDAIEQVAVELAPFDVEYGGFTACNINAVTKAGTNEIHGTAFYDFTSDSLKGDSIDGDDIDNGNYTEKRYGFTVGMPLIKDNLFLFGAYEKKEGVRLHEYAGLARATEAELAEISRISQEVYGYNPGGFKGSSPVTDEKLLLKLDWNINEDHRATLVYNWNDGFTISESDTGTTRLSYDGHFYERGAEIETIVASVYSDWTPDFSTEFRIGKTKLDNRQISVDAATGFGEVQVRTDSGVTVYLGPDDSRQANDLNWDNLTFKLAGTYLLGDHTITAGIEYEDLDVFNLFMQHRIGEYQFNSIADFEAGLANRIYYNNAAGTNDPNDVAASFSFATTTLYAQDEFYFNDDLTLLIGLRYDKWSSDDRPVYNQAFEDKFGFANTGNLDGKDLLQPRVGFNYVVSDDMEVHGGFGLYSGGNPNVWVSNAYSNDGVTQVFAREFRIPGWQSGTTSILDLDLVGNGNPIYAPPQGMYDYVTNYPTNGSSSFVVAMDPNFEIPTEWKYALGLTYLAPGDYLVQADLLYTDKKDAATYIEPAREVTGYGPDGRPVYSGSNSTFLLTNVKGDSGDATTLSLAVSKEYDFGLDVSVAYAYNDSTDVNPMTSSVAGSNYSQFATSDPNDPGVATSNYNIPHRFTLRLGYKQEFIDGYTTRFSVFASANEGRGMSYTFGDNIDAYYGDDDTGGGRQLLYVPTANDANVVYADGFDLDAFNAFIAAEGLSRGKIAGRNSTNGDWWTKVDVRVSQELPAFAEGHSASAFFVIENLGNLLNDDWGVLRQGNFVSESVVEASVNDAGQYVYETFYGADQRDSYSTAASLWEIRVGINYRF